MTDISAPTWVIPATDIGVNELLARFDRKFVISPGARGVVCTGAARLCRAGGTVETTCDRADCTPVLDDVLRALASRLADRGVKVVRDYDRTLPKICARGGELNQV